MANEKIQKMYKLSEVSEILNVTRYTLYKWINNGDIHAVRMGRDWRVPEDVLMKFVEKGIEQ